MLLSLSLIFLVGTMAGLLFERCKAPKIIGMLFTGIILGPFVLNRFDVKILSVSEDLRKIALIIILLRVGFSLDLSDLKKVGRAAILLSFLPALFEMTAYILFAPLLLGLTRIDAAVMGTVLSAVSPAVVVPRMVHYMEIKRGTQKAIPQMIMAGASCDDIVVIVLFTTFLGISDGGHADISGFCNIPISIVLGILMGLVTGYSLHLFFEKVRVGDLNISTKVILILGISFLLIVLEDVLGRRIAVSGLLAIISMASILKIKSIKSVSEQLSRRFGRLWIGAEVILFVLVGAAVDIRYTLDAGLPAMVMIAIGLCFRSMGVLLCIVQTNFSWKEKIFCMIAYLPKATVQAAIGSVPMTMGLPGGKMILSVAVMAILITAPLGAFGMDYTYLYLLEEE